MAYRFSIITPCLNARETIRETIESVLQQRTAAVEYIIIDGGSTDGTLDIINEYADAIDVFISEPDDGISDAFNKGISLATGDYIGIINADDYYEPGALQAISVIAEQHHTPDVIHGSLRYLPATGSHYVEHPNISRIFDYMSVFHPTLFIHRNAYKSVGLYSKKFRYAMDSEWVHRAITAKLTFIQSPEIISNMRLEGTSHQYMHRSLFEFYRSATRHGASQLSAGYYFIRQLMIQTLINIDWVKRAALKRRNKK